MSFEFKLPDLGEGVAEGEVVRWLVKEGDRVVEDQPLAEVLTDKATVEIPSPRAGRVLRLGAAEGERVPVGHVLVEIEEDSSGGASASSPLASEAIEPAAGGAGPAPVGAGSPSVRPAAAEAAGLLRAVEATPAVRSLARELGLDLAQIEGTGPGGRILLDDVRRAGGRTTTPALEEAIVPAPGAAPASGTATSPARETKSQPAPLPAPASADEERIPLRGLRRRIAESMAKSHSMVPQFTFVAEADVTDMVADRERRKAEAPGSKLTFVAYVVRALAPSLRAFPTLNASLDDERGEIVLKHHLHVAVAVATPEGLTVPVVRDADRLSLLDLAREIERLAEAGRAGKLRPEDLTGATFTVTTTGAKGGLLATPIVHHPQVAILGVHAIADRPVVRDGEIVARKMVNLSLSLDHRVVDGQVGADFLYDLVARLERGGQS